MNEEIKEETIEETKMMEISTQIPEYSYEMLKKIAEEKHAEIGVVVSRAIALLLTVHLEHTMGNRFVMVNAENKAVRQYKVEL